VTNINKYWGLSPSPSLGPRDARNSKSITMPSKSVRAQIITKCQSCQKREHMVHFKCVKPTVSRLKS